VIRFAIREARGGIALKLKVRREAHDDADLPLEDLMVFAWAPRKAGVAKNTHYAFLGLLPAPVRGMTLPQEAEGVAQTDGQGLSHPLGQLLDLHPCLAAG
jgi:hypothetical protein